MNEIDLSVVDNIIKDFQAKPSAIIAILQEIQDCYRYLPRETFPRLAAQIGLSEAKIFSVATFYENFSLQPKGRNIIKICDGTACHVRRSLPILTKIRHDLGLTDGQVTTSDLSFTIETVACLGACGLAPVMMVNEKAWPAMTPEKASELLRSIAKEEQC
ncbi:MAG: NAD(P)H-dependent oxidoreductase subunit E [Deltaproteobacteria bacterium]|jgi:NADH-quinone oxidoreductase subunit E|nr:NAD(P)H-dependent oxidoreductase subunit E [Deltaproteobacteria bacterium]